MSNYIESCKCENCKFIRKKELHFTVNQLISKRNSWLKVDSAIGKKINLNMSTPDENENDFGMLSLTDSELEDLKKIFEGNFSDEPPELPDTKSNKSKEKLNKKYRYSETECNYHAWEKTGVGPVSGEVWYNCVYCGVAKEKVERIK